MLRRLRSLIAVLPGILLPVAASAQFLENVRQGVSDAGTPAGFQVGASPAEIVGGIIKIGFSAVGVLLLLLLLYAGFLWMTAGGNEEQVKKARAIITNTIIGIIIVAASYAIADFVIARLTDISTGSSGANSTPSL